jgi:hypothetical protein
MSANWWYTGSHTRACRRSRKSLNYYLRLFRGNAARKPDGTQEAARAAGRQPQLPSRRLVRVGVANRVIVSRSKIPATRTAWASGAAVSADPLVHGGGHDRLVSSQAAVQLPGLTDPAVAARLRSRR